MKEHQESTNQPLIIGFLSFNVEVNPFLHTVSINTEVNDCVYTICTGYESLDDWNSFEIAGKTFDIHYLYEAEFLISIYPVEENKVDYSKEQKVNLTIKLTD